MSQATATPVIFDHRGKAMRARLSLGDYEAARNTRERTLHNGWSFDRPRPESEMLPMHDRLLIIAYLRKSFRNNPVMAAMGFRYALAIGSPTVHAMGSDGGFNDEKERILEKRLSKIMYGTGWSWHRLHKIISLELLICNEVFAVEVEDKVQLIPSEMCGAPMKPVENEYDGIGYSEDGVPSYYRFGVRVPTAIGSNYTRLSFEEADGAQLVDAEFVSHLGDPTRIEERRYAPKLSSVIAQIQNLDDIIKAKVTTVKNQSAMSVFFTKNFDPALFAEASALKDVTESSADTILSQVVARSNYQEMRNGQILYGESGEDVKLIEPSLNAQDFSQFALMLLDQICAPIGLFPEEVLIGYRNSNYSSARADRLRLSDFLKDIRKEREAFCDRVVERQTGIAVDSGDLQDASDGIADITYGWPIVREIDETKHVQAQAVSLANGSKSLDQICAENGTFSDQVQSQIVRSAVRMAKTVKAYAAFPNPSKAQIEAQTVTQAEILAHMPNATAATEALKAIAASEASAVNAEANATRAAAATSA